MEDERKGLRKGVGIVCRRSEPRERLPPASQTLPCHGELFDQLGRTNDDAVKTFPTACDQTSASPIS